MKQIHLPYKGKEYTLEYTLHAVKALEQAGFVLEEIQTKRTLRIPELFYGAFIANHRGIKRNLVDEIYENLKKKDELIAALIDMYDEARNSILDDDEGNVDWTLSE